MGSVEVMASKTTNSAIDALRARHAAERAALEAATEAGAAVRRAQQRRAAELARWDAAVADAEAGADVALAVLASLMPADVAATLTEETPARVRLGQQRAPVEDVTARVEQLSGGAVTVRRRGRPRRSGATRAAPRRDAEVSADAPGTGDEGADASMGERAAGG
jgi:hypothetical protein